MRLLDTYYSTAKITSRGERVVVVRYTEDRFGRIAGFACARHQVSIRSLT